MAIHGELRHSMAQAHEPRGHDSNQAERNTEAWPSRPSPQISRARPNDLFRPLSISLIPIGDIVDSRRLVRQSTKTQVSDIKCSIERFGNRVPILVRGQNAEGVYEVIDGHARLAAARQLGAEEMPCLVVDDLDDTEIRRLALSLNKLQENGEWDFEELTVELAELVALDDDFDFPGFEIAEIEALLLVDDENSVDPANESSENAGANPAVSRPGDVWVLGDHRVLCGTARDAEALNGLLAGQAVDAVWTDPPYNVKINGHVRGREQGFAEFAEGSGEMSSDAFVAFLVETLGLAAAQLKPGGMLYACMDWRHVRELSEALAQIGLSVLNICVWVKSQPGQGSFYRSQYELVFVARKPGARHRNNIELGVHGRNRSNVWTYAGATGGAADSDDDFAAHPTVKPIRLIRDALLDVTIPGELVLDPFLGSGSTLLAAERTRRRCIGIEIDPIYVDVAVRRWQVSYSPTLGQIFG